MADSDPRAAMAELLELMARLRDPVRGCPWDLAQDFASIAPYTIEEAYEVADAIESGDHEKLRDELGDLLFQVVFHARMAQERGWFDFAQVAGGICDKLLRRHPHVFQGTPLAPATTAKPAGASAPSAGTPGALDAATDAALWQQWEAQKEAERQAAARRRGQTGSAVLHDIPRALPALVRATKLGRRASRVGFDWQSPAGVREKVAEELRELDVAVAQALQRSEDDAQPSPEVLEELGDLLFALANFGRHLRVDAETALRAANTKFERRFAVMERLAAERGHALRELSPEQWEALWEQSKSVLQGATLNSMP